MATSKMLDFFPAKFLERMETYQNSEENTSWGAGDDANALWDELGDKWLDEEWTIDNYNSAIAEMCGVSKHTIRMRREVCAGVPVVLRNTYVAIPFHAHRAILPHSGGDAEEHEKIALEWLATADKYNGKIGGIDALRYWLKNRDGAPPWWIGAVNRIRKLALRLASCEDAPLEVREFSNDYASQMEEFDEV